MVERFADFVNGMTQISPSGSEEVPLLPPGNETRKATSLSIAELLLGQPNGWTAGQACQPNALSDGPTITPDLNLCNVKTVTLGGNRTLANPANARGGYCGQIFITQDGTGGRTLGYGSSWYFPGGTAPTLSTAPGAVDVLSFCSASATLIAAQLLQNVQP